MAEHFWVRCKAVNSDQAAALRVVLEGEAIPHVCRMGEEYRRTDRRSPVRREKQTFSYPYPKLED
jgi:hypothetical protein